MATEFSPAPEEAVGLVESLADEHGLSDLSIGVFMRNEAAVTKGREVLAKVYKPPAWAGVYGLDYDIIVELPLSIWQGLNRHQRKAMVDYALCHVHSEYNENKDQNVISMRAPDIQAFSSNLEKFGLWWPKSEAASASFERGRQVALPGIARKGRVESVPDVALQAAREFVDNNTKNGYETSAKGNSITLTPTPEKERELRRRTGAA